MIAYLFERRPDGSIGARYYFDTDEVPEQVVAPGNSIMKIAVRGDESAQELAELRAAKNRPQDYEVRGGKLTKRGERGRAER